MEGEATGKRGRWVRGWVVVVVVVAVVAVVAHFCLMAPRMVFSSSATQLYFCWEVPALHTQSRLCVVMRKAFFTSETRTKHTRTAILRVCVCVCVCACVRACVRACVLLLLLLLVVVVLLFTVASRIDQHKQASAIITKGSSSNIRYQPVAATPSPPPSTPPPTSVTKC